MAESMSCCAWKSNDVKGGASLNKKAAAIVFDTRFARTSKKLAKSAVS